jgi:hypothetical protein
MSDDVSVTGLDSLQKTFDELLRELRSYDQQEISMQVFTEKPYLHDSRESAEDEQNNPELYRILQSMHEKIDTVIK